MLRIRQEQVDAMARALIEQHLDRVHSRFMAVYDDAEFPIDIDGKPLTSRQFVGYCHEHGKQLNIQSYEAIELFCRLVYDHGSSFWEAPEHAWTNNILQYTLTDYARMKLLCEEFERRFIQDMWSEFHG